MKVIRLLFYDGPDEWVLDTIQKSIQGKKEISTKPVPASITAITLGELPSHLEVFLNERSNHEGS